MFTLQGGQPLVGEVVVGLQSFDAGLENLLLLLHLLDPQLQLPLLQRPPLGELLLPALCRLEGRRLGRKQVRLWREEGRREKTDRNIRGRQRGKSIDII